MSAEQRAIELLMQAHLREREIDHRLMRKVVQASSEQELSSALDAIQARLDSLEKVKT
jgi:hypothetical protein